MGIDIILEPFSYQFMVRSLLISIFLPRNDYAAQESCKTIVESELTKNDFSIYGWRQVPVNPKILGDKALQTMPEIIQVLFKSNDPNLLDKNLERKIYETRKRIENKAFEASLNNFYICSISSKSTSLCISPHKKFLLFIETLTESTPQSFTPLIINGITVVFNLILDALPQAATIPLGFI